MLTEIHAEAPSCEAAILAIKFVIKQTPAR